MFIENLRRAKSKWRVGIGILMGLIVISLLATFSYAGNSMNASSASSDTGILASAEAMAEDAEKSAKNAADDATVQGEAASAYLSLAGYMELYLEDPSDAYEKALKYAQNMVTACGSVESPDYESAYGYVLEAQAGLEDADGLSSAFLESLNVMEISEDYLNTYYNYMSSLDAYDQFITDMDTVTEKLEALAADEPEEEESEETEDEEETGNDEAKTPAELMDYAAELVRQATVARDSAE
ncbi:MAG: hypothetical protein ACI3W6_01020 [Clostridia bacterium]